MVMKQLNIENENPICPACGFNEFWLKFYGDKVINLCNKCGYWEEI